MASSQPVSFEEFAQVVERLRGQRAWRSEAGSSTGSIFTLQFGAPLPDDDQEGEFSLIVYCSWRIVEAEQILCTWYEDAKTVLGPALKQLWHSGEVVGAVLSVWGDLTIRFANGTSLQIWNDAPSTEGECWSIGYQGRGYYAVEARNQFIYEVNE